MKNYESPKMIFQELVFFEKIADPCWAIKDNTFDFTNDNLAPLSIDVTLAENGGCGTDTSSIYNQIVEFFTTNDPDNVPIINWKQKYEGNNSLSSTRAAGFKFQGSN